MRKLLYAILALSIISVNHFYHNKDLLKSYVKQRVVYITNDDNTSGGTGSQITAPSGASYILTNAHICDGVGKNGSVKITLNDNTSLYRHIIEISRTTDLCLVEPVPQLAGLSIASKAPLNEPVFAVGHPVLLPTVMAEGELLVEQEVMVLSHYTSPEHPCNLPKQKDVEGLCVESVDAILTNIVIFPGNSGSPVVNIDGQVVAVVFAGSQETNFGAVIPLHSVEQFIRNY